MPKNIDDFNSCVANIMGKLYEIFPKQIRLSANEFPTFEDFAEHDSEEDHHRKVKEGYGLYITYFHTALFFWTRVLSGGRVQRRTPSLTIVC